MAMMSRPCNCKAQSEPEVLLEIRKAGATSVFACSKDDRRLLRRAMGSRHAEAPRMSTDTVLVFQFDFIQAVGQIMYDFAGDFCRFFFRHTFQKKHRP